MTLFTFTACSCTNSLVLLHQPTVLCPSLVLVARDAATQYMCTCFKVYLRKVALFGTAKWQPMHIIQVCYIFAILSLPNFCLSLLISGLPKSLFPCRSSISYLPDSFPTGFHHGPRSTRDKFGSMHAQFITKRQPHATAPPFDECHWH